MIKSFRCKETEKLFNRQRSKKLPQDIQTLAFRKLRMLNRSNTINDLRMPPGNRLEQLSGDREGQYSIRINSQYRICFEWLNGDASNVEIVDYH
ncbi:MAG: type II toxin-antitoxin system RelE/ParE family toxin [Prolixibacteraceae bacterium]|nr:type II toxin-antitoxin system RelE/ParE family toxin [Prolixibacteraceae bacterium]